MSHFDRVLPYAAAAFMLLGGLLVVLNALWWMQGRRSGRPRSPVPLVGALFLGSGLALLPATRPYCWIAILVDYGTLSLLAALPRIAREFSATSRANLIENWRSETDARTVELRLYRKGVFVLQQTFQRRPGEAGLTQASTTGQWRREGTRVLLHTWDKQPAEFDQVPQDSNLVQTLGIRSFEDSPETELNGIYLRRVQ